jgi:hypothetical protein
MLRSAHTHCLVIGEAIEVPFRHSQFVRHALVLVVVVVFITVTCTANGGHWVPPGGLQAYSLPQPWLCRAPKVRRGGEGDACVSMETCNIKIHNREHRFPNSVPISGP